MRLAFRFLLCSAAVWVSACTRPNPDFCCSSPSECSALGVDDDLRACADHKVCDANVCKDIQCSTAAECDGASPYCSNQVCKASCAGDGDCLGAAGPICADDGVCVGCRGNDDCSEAAPICDLATRACAPCRADADCTESGVCLAADGVCAKPGAIVYVREGGADVATCQNKASPCGTLAFALTQTTALRNVIRLLGSMYRTDSEIVVNSRNVYIDGENTELQRTTTGTLASFVGSSRATLEGVRITPTASNAINVSSSELVRLSQLTATGTGFDNALFVQSGTAKVSDSSITSATLLCGTATLVVETSELRGAHLDGGSTCVGQVRRNKLRDTQVNITGGLIFKNNLVISTSPTCSNSFSGGGADEVDFNTWVCRHNPPIEDEFQGKAFTCQPGMRATGNLLAWDSTSPTRNCILRHSLLPSFAVAQPGEGNVSSDLARVFVDYLGGDYHLSADSPARGAAEPQPDVTTDLEGRPRPNPTGTNPDIGAFEAP